MSSAGDPLGGVAGLAINCAALRLSSLVMCFALYVLFTLSAQCINNSHSLSLQMGVSLYAMLARSLGEQKVKCKDRFHETHQTYCQLPMHIRMKGLQGDERPVCDV